MSELRGIGLVVLAANTLAYYYSWWFAADRLSSWLAVAFIMAFSYGLIQLAGNWTLYLATHYRPTNYPSLSNQKFTVDIFITACNESHALVKKALLAASALPEEKKIWLLDDGNDPALAQMAAKLGVGYLTRPDRQHAKAGNINAALCRTSGDIVVIFDIDHMPKPDFLTKSLGSFVNPDVGFVQVMLTFGNSDESWISKATADTSLDYYNPISIGADGLRSTTLIGSNALIRRKALDSIQGYQHGLAEDLATSIALHAAGWHSVYIAEPLAPGIAPPDLTSWFTQQLKWSRGVFELLLTDFPRYFWKLQPGQRIMYAVRMTYYWVGLFVAVHLLLTIGVFWCGSAEVLRSYEQYLEHLAPLIGMTLVLRHLALRRWKHPSIKDASFQWKPIILVFATWPVYTLSWFMAIFRVSLRFRPTPKTATGLLHPAWVLPQIVSAVLLLVGLFYSITTIKSFYVFVSCFALAQAAAQLFLVNEWLRSVARRYASTTPSHISSQTLTETPSDTSASVEDGLGI